MTILFLFLLLFLLMFIGVPIAASLGLAGSVTIMLFSPDSVRSLAIKLFETSEHYTLLAIPFFLLSGAFMTTGGVAQRSDRLCQRLRRPYPRRSGDLGGNGLHAVCRAVGLVARHRGGRGLDCHRRHGALGLPAGLRAGIVCNAGTWAF